MNIFSSNSQICARVFDGNRAKDYRIDFSPDASRPHRAKTYIINKLKELGSCFGISSKQSMDIDHVLSVIVLNRQHATAEQKTALGEMKRELKAISVFDTACALQYLQGLSQEFTEEVPDIDQRIRVCALRLEECRNRYEARLANQEMRLRHVANLGGVAREIGIETLNARRTVPALLEAYESEEAYIKALDNPTAQQVARRGYLLGQIAFLKDEVAKGKVWVTANDYRDHGRSNHKGFHPKRAAERYISVPENAAYHEYHSDSVNFRTYRCAALSDHRDGGTNLGALKQELQAKQKLGIECVGLEQQLRERRWVLEDKMLMLLNDQANLHRDKIFAEGSLPLARGRFSVTHLLLVNPTQKPKSEKKQFIKSEQTLTLDMAEIFQEFDGRTLVFDGQGPFIDEDGRVHLAIEELDPASGRARELTLDTSLFQVSLHSHTKNEGIQRELNIRALEKSRALLNDIVAMIQSEETLDGTPLSEDQLANFKKVHAQATREYNKIYLTLSKKNLGDLYDLSVRIQRLNALLGCATGTSCFSAKDRTGAILAYLVDGYIQDNLNLLVQAGSLTKKQVKSALKQIRKRYFDRFEGIAAPLVFRNTGYRVLKVKRFGLLGVGALDRIAMYIESAATKENLSPIIGVPLKALLNPFV